MDADAVASMFTPLAYVGTVEAVRQGYQIFRTAGGDYLVFNPSSRGGASFHMTLVSKEKVEAVEKGVTRSGVTSGSLLKDEKVAATFGPEDSLALRFDLLMALYILTALGRVDMEKSGRTLSFTKRAK
jgi:hypothetical protein